jgi:hypothetical protein
MSDELHGAAGRWERWLSAGRAGLERCGPPVEWASLQAGHRAGSLSALLLVAGAVLAVLGRPAETALWWGAAAGGAGVAAGMIALGLAQCQHRPRREAAGMMIFSAACAMGAMGLALWPAG